VKGSVVEIAGRIGDPCCIGSFTPAASPHQPGAIVMDYLVDFTVTVPEGTPASELEQRTSREEARVAELAAQGHALRVWKPLPDDGRLRAIGLYRAADDDELQAILESLPLRPWMEISVTALAEHPNDPALASARAAAE
jgi:muconolactone D-isomerase